MKRRHPEEYIRRRLLERSAENVETPAVNGCRCRDVVRGLKEARAGHDYGRLWDGERLQYMHRLSFEVWVGPIPAGMDVLHRCDRPRCIEPRHLWAGTHQENLADMVSKGRHLAGAARRGLKTRGRPSKSRGSKHGLAKLTEDQVRALKPKLLSGRVKIAPLARSLGVSASLLRGIRDGKNWSWL